MCCDFVGTRSFGGGSLFRRVRSVKFHNVVHSQSACGLRQIGCRDALRRFGGDDGCRRAGNAGEWMSRNFKVFGEPGDVLVLNYDTAEGKFSHRVVDRRREDDDKLSATWARERVRNWREGW